MASACRRDYMPAGYECLWFWLIKLPTRSIENGGTYVVKLVGVGARKIWAT